jgi:hypothetical protein
MQAAIARQVLLSRSQQGRSENVNAFSNVWEMLCANTRINDDEGLARSCGPRTRIFCPADFMGKAGANKTSAKNFNHQRNGAALVSAKGQQRATIEDFLWISR